MEYKLQVYCIWHSGKRVDADGNPHQEDSMYPEYEKATSDDRLFILCDGMGGHDAGEVASATVCEAMSSSILSTIPTIEGEFTEDIIQKAISDAFDALDAKDDGTSIKKMGTTMTLLKLHGNGYHIAHMGDSRVYHIRPGKTAKDTKIIFRTEDHSLVNDLVKIGELTPEEARHSSQKNVITRAMQPNMERRPKADIYHSIDVASGDYFYLCSDGMLENMEDHQLCYFFSEEAGNDAKKRDSLLKATQENKDNHSAIIIHILEVQGFIPKLDTLQNESNLNPKPLMGEIHDDVTQESGVACETLIKPAKDGSNFFKSKWQSLGKKIKIIIVLILVVLVIIICFPHANKEGDSKSDSANKELKQPINESSAHKKGEGKDKNVNQKRSYSSDINTQQEVKELNEAKPSQNEEMKDAPKVDEHEDIKPKVENENQVQNSSKEEEEIPMSDESKIQNALQSVNSIEN